MPDLWRPGDDETKELTDKRAKNLLDYLLERKQKGDRWASLLDIQMALSIDEFTAVGIIIYLWMQDLIWTDRGEMGDLMLMHPYVEPPDTG